MPDLALVIVNTTVTPISERQSRVDLVLADGPDVESADETVALSIVVDHQPVPFFAELQLAALRRTQTALTAQIRHFAQIVGRVRP